MKFKIDENLPVELAGEFLAAGHEAVTVDDQQLVGSSVPDLFQICRIEARILVTLDLDFADIRTYPPDQHPGLIVLRLARQDKSHVLDVFRKMLEALLKHFCRDFLRFERARMPPLCRTKGSERTLQPGR